MNILCKLLNHKWQNNTVKRECKSLPCKSYKEYYNFVISRTCKRCGEIKLVGM